MFLIAAIYHTICRALSKWLAALHLLVTLAQSGVPVRVTQRGFAASRDAIKVAWVNGQLALIYHRDSSLPDELQQQLESLVNAHGGLWLRDRRKLQCAFAGADRRKATRLPVLFCWLSACIASASNADQLAWKTSGTQFGSLALQGGLETGFYASSADNTTMVRQLGLFSIAPRSHQFEFPSVHQSGDKSVSSLITESGVPDVPPLTAEESRALAILNDKWRPGRNDPVSMASELEQLARYIAGQPKVLALLHKLEKQPLRLAYAAGQFTTVVKGTQFQVRSATVYFDPFSAAVFGHGSQCEEDPGHCVASPADAFVHELLHARIALLESKRFIRSGAMNSLVYPYAHEREVLREERSLYQSMSQHDQRSRPQRRQHSGHLQAASCVTCLDAG